ncbi:hypothetical protein DFR65_105104 [Oceanihabitans sediminis]|uniref:Uncharacterized protein n=1 Tax=Oceanihabitans sediminis TaxID=1812012 RepID=A0A368P5P4_9FLAO|nr:hypothetical protein [Oceanihabitans sediminis]RBP29878.1 hypothetical protein DFR65_105104 [Oceanihabitans sediminis]RCU57215.1 hypothetical protein DU428_09745 [Oceanihabitans sediminis]
MKKTIIAIITLALFSACKKEINPYTISKQNIGLLTDSTQVKDIDAIYTNDSIVKRIAGDEFIGGINDIEIYDKNGKLLLLLTPKQVLDSTSTITTIKVVDPRFKTDKGLNTASTFADIKNNYTISSIQNTLRNVVVFVNDINGFFTIDKKELPAELRIDMNKKIEAVHIPDGAKIKHFMIGW